MTNDNFDTDEELIVSKSQRKREMLALQDMGQMLTELDAATLQKCQLPDDLLAAINEFKRLPNKHGARKRQLQFIGKIMRKTDTTKIEEVLDNDQQQANHDRRLFQQLEVIREDLLQDSDETLHALIMKFPELDIQHLRQLIRQAKKEAEQQKPPAASRKIFKYLRELYRDS